MSEGRGVITSILLQCVATECSQTPREGRHPVCIPHHPVSVKKKTINYLYVNYFCKIYCTFTFIWQYSWSGETAGSASDGVLWIWPYSRQPTHREPPGHHSHAALSEGRPQPNLCGGCSFCAWHTYNLLFLSVIKNYIIDQIETPIYVWLLVAWSYELQITNMYLQIPLNLIQKLYIKI